MTLTPRPSKKRDRIRELFPGSPSPLPTRLPAVPAQNSSAGTAYTKNGSNILADALEALDPDDQETINTLVPPTNAVSVGHNGIVNAVAFSQDGKAVASGSRDKTIRLWDVATGEERQKLEGHYSWVNAVSFSPDGKTVASASADFTIRLWDTATGKERQKLEGHYRWVNAIAFSPDGKTVASGSGDSTVRLWDVATGEARQKLEGHNGIVNAVAFSPDGKAVVSGSADSTVRLWEAATGEERQKLEGHNGYVKAVAFSPVGNIVASGSKDETVRLWDVATGEERQNLQGHNNRVNAVAFSPDGSIVVSGSEDKTIRLWDVATGEERQKLGGHYSWVNAVAFSPDGKTVASGSADFTVRLWDVATGEEKPKLEGHNNRVNAVAFSPDDNTVTSVSDGKTVSPLDTATGGERQNTQGYGSASSTDNGIGKAINQGEAQPDLAVETAERLTQRVVLHRIVSQGLAGLYRTTATWCRPKLRGGFSRLEWDCCCGQQFWGDFKHTEHDRLKRLILGFEHNGFTVKVTTASVARSVPNNNADQHGATSTSNSILPVLNKTPDTAESQVPWKNKPSTTVSQTSFQDAGRPVHLELCINRSSEITQLGEITLVPALGEPLVKNDKQLFDKIRSKYTGHKRKGLFAFLYRPQDIEYVRFGYQVAAGQTDVYQPPGAIPPCEEVRKKRYHYSECPLETLPPMPRQTFYQYFHRHEPNCASRSTMFCDRLPKKLGASMTTTTGADKLVFGWGVHIIEGPNKPVLAILIAIILGVSFTVSVLYNIFTGNKDSGFAIGQWIVAVLSATLAAVYFHLQEL